MRHRNSGRRFGRTTEQRKALFQSLANAIIQHERIKTTLAKAKDIRRVVEPLITRAKEDTVAHRRYVFDRLRNRKTVGLLFNEVAPRFKERNGGYLRVLKNGYRLGDGAPMAVVELVERSEV